MADPQPQFSDRTVKFLLALKSIEGKGIAREVMQVLKNVLPEEQIAMCWMGIEAIRRTIEETASETKSAGTENTVSRVYRSNLQAVRANIP